MSKNIHALYAGTFDPIHYGHLDLITRGAEIFDTLTVGVYDHRIATKKTVFSVDERCQMIEDSVADIPNVKVSPFTGLLVDFANAIGVTVLVRGMRVFSDFEFEFRSALANKRLAPNIESVMLMSQEQHMFLSGTTVREIASLGGDVGSMVPPHVARALYEVFKQQRAHYNNS